MKRTSPFLSVVLLGSVLVAQGELIPRKPTGAAAPSASASPLSSEEMAKLREQVDQLEKDLEKKRGGMHSAQIAILRDAMSGNDKAFNFWLDCKKEQDFEMKGKTATEFAEWKRGQIKTTGTNDAFCGGLRLQIHFLMLAVLHSHADTPAQEAEVAGSAVAYMEALTVICEKEETLAKAIVASIIEGGVDANESVTVQNLQETLAKVREASSALGGGILDSIFAKHLKLDGSVHPKGGAATNAGNIDEIYDRLILEPLRKKKDAAGIAAAWSRRIDQTGRVAKATKIKEIEERYAEVKVPAMKFAMYRDQWTAGQQKQAALSMIALIGANPAHKDSQDWMQELKRMTSGDGADQ